MGLRNHGEYGSMVSRNARMHRVLSYQPQRTRRGALSRIQHASQDDRSVSARLREMHMLLLAGYPADAVLHAAAIAEMAIRAILVRTGDVGVKFSSLLSELRHQQRHLHADAAWLHERRGTIRHLAGEVRSELDSDGRRAADIATCLALTAELISDADLDACQAAAGSQASDLLQRSDAVLRLDRGVHRKALEDLITLRRRLLVFMVHGEIDQGHDHFGEITTWRLRSEPKGRWREIVVKWPPPAMSLGVRLAVLFEELANALGLQLSLPVEDPTTSSGVLAWMPRLAPMLRAIDAQRERLLVRHVLRWIDVGAGGDHLLVDAYVRMIWATVAVRPGQQVAVGFECRRVQRGGIPLGKAWRISRAEHTAAKAIAGVLDRLHLAHGGTCFVFPELTSIVKSDLVDWLCLYGDRKRHVALVEAARLVSSTQGGRFDRIVERLTALKLQNS